MNRFFDDLWALLRLRFQPVERYHYPLPLILLVLVPSLFEWVLMMPESPGAGGSFKQIFTHGQYIYIFFYITQITQLFTYGWIFKVFLWPKNKTVSWINVISFLSLTYLIDACSLFFYFSAHTLFLASFIKAFALVLMFFGVKILSQRNWTAVFVSWAAALLTYLLINGLIFFLALQAGMVDGQKYQDYANRQFEAAGIAISDKNAVKK